MKQDQLFNKKQLAEAKSRHVINDTHIRGRNIANTIIKEKKKNLPLQYQHLEVFLKAIAYKSIRWVKYQQRIKLPFYPSLVTGTAMVTPACGF